VALIELGKLLEQAAAGRQPETNVTVAELIDRYAEVADWDLSTPKAHEVYIRRVIKPALGHLQVRKIRSPLLDLLYAQLRRCGDPGCTGKRFVEHRNVPTLGVVTPSPRPACCPHTFGSSGAGRITSMPAWLHYHEVLLEYQ
jgi:hypothetical protein